MLLWDKLDNEKKRKKTESGKNKIHHNIIKESSVISEVSHNLVIDITLSFEPMDLDQIR